MKNQTDYKKEYTFEFLFKEYDRIHSLWMDENHQVEQRVNFFLTIASASVGGLIVISQITALPVSSIGVAAEGILILLLLFGVTVLNRLNLRTVQVRALRQSMQEIQKYFATHDTEISSYLENQKKYYFVPDYKNIFFRHIQNSFTGGLNDLMIISNALICGGITLVALISNGFDIKSIAVWTAITILGTERIWRIYSNFVVRKLRPWRLY